MGLEQSLKSWAAFCRTAAVVTALAWVGASSVAGQGMLPCDRAPEETACSYCQQIHTDPRERLLNCGGSDAATTIEVPDPGDDTQTSAEGSTSTARPRSVSAEACSSDPIGQDCIACLAELDQAESATKCGDRLAPSHVTAAEFQCPTSKSRLEALGPIALAAVRDYLVAGERFKASLRPFEQSGGADCDALPEYFLNSAAPVPALEAALEEASALPATIHQCLTKQIDFFTTKAQDNPQDRFFLGAVVDLTSLQIALEIYLDRLYRAYDEVEAKRETIANYVDSCSYR